MGCDIHCHIEWKHYQTSDGEWRISNYSQPYFGRNYPLFGMMAGVRYSDLKMFEPRGVPKDICFWTTLPSYTLRITEDGDYEGVCSPELARQWISDGSSEYWVDSDGEETGRVTNPDWHTPSFLYAFELTEVAVKYADLYCADGTKVPETFMAIIRAMEALNDGDPYRSRLVFWFDN